MQCTQLATSSQCADPRGGSLAQHHARSHAAKGVAKPAVKPGFSGSEFPPPKLVPQRLLLEQDGHSHR